MSQKLNGKLKRDYFDEISKNTIREYLAAGYDVKEYDFSNGMNDGTERTDLSLSLSQLMKGNKLTNTEGIVLVSDGWFHDSGLEAVQLAGRSIYPIVPDIQNTDEDIWISGTEFNENAFRNEDSPFVVHCRSIGFAGKATLSFTVDEKLVTKKDLDFSKNNLLEVDFSYIFTELGLRNIQFLLEAQDVNEKLLTNNSATSIVKVIDAKETVLIVTDAVNWESKFVHDALRNNPRLQPSVVIAKNHQLYAGRTLLNKNLKNLDYTLLILINNGHLQLSKTDSDAIIDKLTNGKGVLLIGMPLTNLDMVAPMAMANVGRVFEDSFGSDPKMTEFRTFDMLKTDIAGIPPVLYKYYKLNSGGEVLAHFNNKELSPAIAIKKSGKGTFLHLGMLNLWKWQLWSNTKNYLKFVVSLCNWLSNSSEDRIAFYSNRSGYKQGEIIAFTLKAYDEKMEQLVNLQPELEIFNSKDKSQFKDYMDFDGASYRLDVSELPVGKYKSVVRDRKNNITAETEFIVDESGLEDTNFGINRENLQYLATLSEGRIVDKESYKDNTIDKVYPEKVRRNIEIPLYRKRWLLLLFLLTFCTELWIRRRKGLL
jgi:hypothetical protein